MKRKLAVFILPLVMAVILLGSWYLHTDTLKDARGAIELAQSNRFFLIAQDVAQQIRRGMVLGKPLEHFGSMDRVLKKANQASEGILALAIGTVQGQILYKSQPDFIPRMAFHSGGTNDYQVEWTPASALLVSPIRGTDNSIQGLIWLKFSALDRNVMVQKLEAETLVPAVLGSLLASLLFLGCWFLLVRTLPPALGPDIREFSLAFTPVVVRMTLALALSLVLGAGFQSYLDNTAANRIILRGHGQNLDIIARNMQSEFEYLLSIGVEPTMLSKADNYLQAQLKDKPAIDTIALIQRNGRVIHGADLRGPWSDEQKSKPVFMDDSTGKILVPIREPHKATRVYLYLSSTINMSELNGTLLRKFGDLVGTLAIALIFILELLFLLPIMLVKGPLVLPRQPNSKPELAIHDPGVRLMRIGAHLAISGEVMVAPFANSIYQGATGLPALCYFAGIALAMVLSTRFFPPRLLRRALITGVMLLALGYGASLAAQIVTAQEPELLNTVGRLLAGLGSGTLLGLFPLSFRYLSLPDNGRHFMKFVLYGVGTAAIAGFTLAGILADTFGPPSVSIYALIQTLILAGLILRGIPAQLNESPPERRFTTDIHQGNTALVLSGFFVLVFLLADFLPLLGLRASLDATERGRILAISGLAIVLIPLVSRMALTRRTKVLIILATNSAGALAMLALALDPGILQQIIASLMGGLMLVALSLYSVKAQTKKTILHKAAEIIMIGTSYFLASMYGPQTALYLWVLALPLLAMLVLVQEIRKR